MNWTRHCGTDHVTEQCGEVGRNDDGDVVIRNSQRPGEVVTMDDGEWAQFLDGARTGAFDRV